MQHVRDYKEFLEMVLDTSAEEFSFKKFWSPLWLFQMQPITVEKPVFVGWNLPIFLVYWFGFIFNCNIYLFLWWNIKILDIEVICLCWSSLFITIFPFTKEAQSFGCREWGRGRDRDWTLNIMFTLILKTKAGAMSDVSLLLLVMHGDVH